MQEKTDHSDVIYPDTGSDSTLEETFTSILMGNSCRIPGHITVQTLETNLIEFIFDAGFVLISTVQVNQNNEDVDSAYIALHDEGKALLPYRLLRLFKRYHPDLDVTWSNGYILLPQDLAYDTFMRVGTFETTDMSLFSALVNRLFTESVYHYTEMNRYSGVMNIYLVV